VGVVAERHGLRLAAPAEVRLHDSVDYEEVRAVLLGFYYYVRQGIAMLEIVRYR
jgi:hypothetical protein